MLDKLFKKKEEEPKEAIEEKKEEEPKEAIEEKKEEEPKEESIEERFSIYSTALLNEVSIEKLEENIKNIEMVLQKARDRLAMLKEVKNKKEEIKQKIDKYKELGYSTKRFENIFDKDIALIEKEFSNFEDDIEKLKILGERIEEDAEKYKIFEKELSFIRSKLNDPDALSQITKEIFELDIKIRKIEAEKKEAIEKKERNFRKKIEKYMEEGYVVTRLENVMNEDLETIEREFESFENDIDVLKTLDERVKKIGRGYEKEIEKIIGRLKDVDAIPEIEEVLTYIEKKDVDGKKLLGKKIEDWKREGYVVTRLEKLLKEDRVTIEEGIKKYESDILELKSFEERFKALDKTYSSDVLHIRGLLSNPDNIPEIEKRINVLEKKIESRKEELIKKLEDYKELGYVTKRLDGIFDKDIALIEKEFAVFEADIEKLKILSEKFGADIEIDKTFEKDISSIRRKLNDPDAIPMITREILELNEKIRKREVEVGKAGEKKRELYEKMEKYIEEGYVVDRLENVMNKDLETIEREFESFENDVDVLKTLGERVKKIGRGHEEEIEKIIGKLKDVDAIPEIEEVLTFIEKKDAEVKKDIRKKIEDWKGEGYVVTKLEKILKADIASIEDELKIFESDVLELKKLEKKLEEFSGLYDSDVASIRKLLNDPDNIPDIEKKIDELEKRKKEKITPPAVTKEEELGAKITKLEKEIKKLEEKNIDVVSGKNMIKYAKTFLKRENYSKAMHYIEKAEEIIKELKKID